MIGSDNLTVARAGKIPPGSIVYFAGDAVPYFLMNNHHGDLVAVKLKATGPLLQEHDILQGDAVAVFGWRVEVDPASAISFGRHLPPGAAAITSAAGLALVVSQGSDAETSRLVATTGVPVETPPGVTMMFAAWRIVAGSADKPTEIFRRT